MKLNPVVRATGIIGATAALVTGVTFAALSSSATLTNNTIATGSAELLVNNTDNETPTPSGFVASDEGYDFTGVIPGVPTSGSTGNFQLKNDGDVDLAVSLSLDGLPNWTVLPSGSVTNSKVDVVVSCTGVTSGAFSLTADVASLVPGPVSFTGASLDAGDTATCTVQVQMDGDAFVGSNASSDDFNFVFTGTGV